MTPLDQSVSFPICGAPHLQITKSNQAESKKIKDKLQSHLISANATSN